MKIVINTCFGGFGLSEAAVRRYAELKGLRLWVESDKWGNHDYWLVPPEDRQSCESPAGWSSMPLVERQAWNDRYNAEHLIDRDIERSDPILVCVVEQLGKASSGRFSELRVVTIPDGANWEIEEYDGMEHVAETHRTWR